MVRIGDVFVGIPVLVVYDRIFCEVSGSYARSIVAD